MSALWQDIRFAVRTLARGPAFTAAALITLALGIGVNTAAFSVIDAASVQPHWFDRADELVFLRGAYEQGARERAPVGALDVQDWREQAQSFSEIGLMWNTAHILTGGDREPERVRGAKMSANMLPMLGFDARLGRLFTANEDVPGAERVVMLTDRLWERRFNRSQNALGQTLILDDTPHTIVGVLPPQLNIQTLFFGFIDVLAPMRMDAAELDRGSRGTTAIARLAPGVSAEQAEAELVGITARLAQAYPDTNEDVGAWVQPIMDEFRSADERWAQVLLLVMVGAVLLIACVNLANLLLAKATVRGKEYAVRTALGAGRGRIIRQLLTESLLLALIGGLVGLVAGRWVFDLIMPHIPHRPPGAGEAGLNAGVLMHTLLLSLAAALVFGLAPALLASRVSVCEALKEATASASASRSRNRLRSTLVVGQLALGLPLLMGCGLVVRSLHVIRTADLGYEPEQMLTMRIDLPSKRYPEDAQRAGFFRDAASALEAVPGVDGACAMMAVPVTHLNPQTRITIEGRDDSGAPDGDAVGFKVVTPGYFRLMGVPLMEGRLLAEHDRAEAEKVVLVNRRLAERYWPDESALGKRIKRGGGDSEEEWMTVIGVVGEASASELGEPPRPGIIVPHEQLPYTGMVLAARTVGDPMAAAGAARQAIGRIDPNQPIADVQTMRAAIDVWFVEQRASAWMLGGLSLLSLALAGFGLYGVMSYAVARRTHEIGVRMAVGAGRSEILRLVIRRCLVLSAVGIVVGLVITAPVNIILGSFLPGIGVVDPVTLLGVVLVFIGVALLAGYLPARRATKIDPIVALRYE